ncbi:TPA: hypothetical protein N0F65_011931 [Lagenidium giganteum]|uniref:Uncharacterized protein n=1 Tax=Lagenidium giganteum TaxID=4803 RepID=A0AAV2YTG6_9STRA|nr:TPA: hypothetical protein N0F65_011931 [Lagenidium giganteum]
MKRSWRLLQARHPENICNGCAANAMNLLLKNVFTIPTFENVLSSCVALTKFVLKRAALLARFRQHQYHLRHVTTSRKALSIPEQTRWYASLNCIKSVHHSRVVLVDLFGEEDILNRMVKKEKFLNLRDTIQRNEFWSQVQLVITHVSPIQHSLGVLERDDCCLSMVYHEVHELMKDPVSKQNSSDDDFLRRIKADILQFVNERWRFIKTLQVAYLLDATKPVSGFAEDDLRDALEAAVEIARTLKRQQLATHTTEQVYDDLVAFV